MVACWVAKEAGLTPQMGGSSLMYWAKATPAALVCFSGCLRNRSLSRAAWQSPCQHRTSCTCLLGHAAGTRSLRVCEKMTSEPCTGWMGIAHK